MDEIEGLLNGGHHVATREQLVDVIGRVRLDTQVRSGRLQRVFPRTYARPWDVDLPDVRRHAALASVGGQVALSHLSALTAWNLPAPEDGPLHLTAYQPRHPRGVSGELVVHRTLLPLSPVWIGDLPVVSLEIALVTSWPLLAGDPQRAPIIEASRRRLIRPDVLSRCVESMHWIRGRGELRDLAGLVLSGCQSELELWGHLHVFDAEGLRHGARQRTICVGGKEFRIDLAYEDVRVAVELDGRARARARNGRLDRARARRLVLDKGRAERDARIDAAVADVYQAQEDQAAAGQAIVEADRRIGEAIRRLIVEGITTAQAAQLCELSVTAVQRLKAESADLPGEPVTSSLSMVARTSVVGSSDAGSASAAGVVA